MIVSWGAFFQLEHMEMLVAYLVANALLGAYMYSFMVTQLSSIALKCADVVMKNKTYVASWLKTLIIQFSTYDSGT